MDGQQIEARVWAWLALAMIVGFALRTVAIGDQALWADEALTYVLAQSPAGALASAPIDPTPPLYYWLHQWLIPDGASAAVGRSISLVAGMLAIPATFLLGRALVGHSAAGFAAAWVAVSAPLVDYSQEARPYALLVLLILMSALALDRTLREPRRRWPVAIFALTTILALYTHFVAWFWAALALAMLLKLSPRRGVALLASGVVIVMAIPEMARVLRYATEANAFHWLAQPGPGDFIRLLLDQWFAFGAVALSAGFAAVLVVVGVARRAPFVTWVRSNRASALILAALLLQPFALWLFGFVVSPVLMERTMLPSLPAVGIAIAVILPAAGAARFAIVLAVLSAALTATLVGGTVRSKEAWRATRPILARADPARELIITCPNWKAPALMAATRGLRSAPLVTVAAGRMRLIERQLGGELAWDRAYHANIFVPDRAPALGIATPAARAMVVESEALLLVLSECSPEERAAIAGWANGFSIRQRWTSGAGENHAAIVIERWRLDEPHMLTLYTNR